MAAVNYRGGRRHPAQVSGKTAGGHDAGKLLQHPARIESALVGLTEDLLQQRIPLVQGATDSTPDTHAVLDVLIRTADFHPRPDQGLQGSRPGWRQETAVGAGHDRGQRQHPLGSVGRHQLADHAAHGRTHQMGAVDVERIQQSAGVFDHVMQTVRGMNVQARHVATHQPHGAVSERTAQAGRQTHVAVIKTDHAVAALRQIIEQRLRPEHHLGTQPHDKDNGLALLGSPLVVKQLQPVAGYLSGFHLHVRFLFCSLSLVSGLNRAH